MGAQYAVARFEFAADAHSNGRVHKLVCSLSTIHGQVSVFGHVRKVEVGGHAVCLERAHKH